MAKVELLASKILKWEGGYVNDPTDRGGATNKGVTLSTWKQVGYDKDGDGDIDHEDIKLLTIQDATRVLKAFYWDRWRADEILNQSIADILVDWVWASGKWGIKIPQRILKVEDDGMVGPRTIKTVNNVDQYDFFKEVWTARKRFIEKIVENDPTQKKFLKGWMNRLNDYSFSS